MRRRQTKYPGKLVATNPTTGLLPNNIIAKALNTETLDGLDSAAFLLAGDKAADADKLDGREASELVPVQAAAEVVDPDYEPLTDSVEDVAEVSITVPGAGRIQVDGQSVVQAWPSVDNYVFASFSISTMADAHNPSPAGTAFWDIPSIDTLMDGMFRTTVPTTRTFEVTGAGTYTYYLVAEGSGDTSDGPFHLSSQINAQYFPAP